MSRLHKAVLGLPQGTLGHLVFRIRKGIPFIYTRPVPFIPGTEPEDFARRAKFGMAVKFSKYVNSIPQLKTLWEKLGNSYSEITRRNYLSVTGSTVENTAALTPFGGIGVSVTSAVLTNEEIHVEIDALTIDDKDPLETRIRLVGVMLLSGPIGEDAPDHYFLPIICASQAFNPLQPTIVNKTLDTGEKTMFDLYTNQKLFYAFVTEDVNGNVYNYSSTNNVS